MRASGVLMHISSLPSEYGVGTLGREAYKFVDFLVKSGQTYWQVLPICPTSYGDSPYQSFSTHAGNPYFIDFDMLKDEKLLKKSDYAQFEWVWDEEKVDYANLYYRRFDVLKIAYENFKQTPQSAFEMFLEENENWISNYALFMTIKEENGGKCWLEWEEGLRCRDPHSLWRFKSMHEDEVRFWEFVQFKFFEQWNALKEYANSKGIQIIGDIPIYVALDSAAVWVYPDLFELDENLVPTAVAGCPPDAFSPTGQLWGNPLYKWERHKETDYSWWIDRLKASAKLFDMVRIDHFRGFDEYYAIPYGDKTAEGGRWLPGPGIEFFRFVEARLGKLPIIAEDLGFLTPSVLMMLKESGFPGMKVLEFAFDPREESSYLPYNYDKNCVCYIGTHDNNTIIGWSKEMDAQTMKFCRRYLDIDPKDKSNSTLVWKFIKTAFASVADTVIIQAQDILELGEGARMNTPSTPAGNWQWRAKKGVFTTALARKLKDITITYGRCPRE
ncbi:MAG: 4-alpha-glucanotransferase [Clostridiales bacterium]|nr:4-alpha-glucanotransferase [Clostridiales bacterium]